MMVMVMMMMMVLHIMVMKWRDSGRLLKYSGSSLSSPPSLPRKGEMMMMMMMMMTVVEVRQCLQSTRELSPQAQRESITGQPHDDKLHAHELSRN
jgi:hypothetical protein